MNRHSEMATGTPPALFVRVGWMRFYQGVQEKDPKPIGGGKYNQDNVGHEVCNFRLIDDTCYAYFQPTRGRGQEHGKRVNLVRIAPGYAGDSLDGVTLVFVSTPPGGDSLVVVGWYRDAIVFREMQPQDAVGRDGLPFLAQTSKENAVLLPTKGRVWPVPRKKGAMGQSNICYILKKDGTPKPELWWRKTLAMIDAYEGPNLLGNELLEQEEYVASVSGGQGFGLNVAERRAVEMHAMDLAVNHFRKEGYVIEDTHASKPYDLLCRKEGLELHVEVKGSTGQAEYIFLTKNEVALAQDPNRRCALFIVSEVTLDRATTQASGGKCVVHQPWTPQSAGLEVLQYRYDLGKHTKIEVTETSEAPETPIHRYDSLHSGVS